MKLSLLGRAVTTEGRGPSHTENVENGSTSRLHLGAQDALVHDVHTQQGQASQCSSRYKKITDKAILLRRGRRTGQAGNRMT